MVHSQEILSVLFRPRMLLLILFVLLLAACTAAPVAEPSVPATTPGVLAIVDAWARPVPVDDGNSAIYLTILNGLDNDVTLTGAETTIAGMTQLHETTNNNGVMSMEHAPEGWTIPVGGSLTLEPGGKHIMLMHVAGALAEGDEVALELVFDNGDVEQLVVPVAAE